MCSRPKLFCGTQGTEKRCPVLRHDRETLGLSGFCAEPVERETWSLGPGLSLNTRSPSRGHVECSLGVWIIYAWLHMAVSTNAGTCQESNRSSLVVNANYACFCCRPMKNSATYSSRMALLSCKMLQNWTRRYIVASYNCSHSFLCDVRRWRGRELPKENGEEPGCRLIDKNILVSAVL